MTDCEVHSRRLPDGRYELTLGQCIPVIVRAETFAAKSRGELFVLVGRMTLIAHALAEQHGYDFPLQTGKFVEAAAGGGKFSLKEGA